MDTNLVDIVAEDIAVIEVVLVDIEQSGIEVVLIHLASAHHSLSIRYQLYSLAVAEILCNISHHVL